MRLRRAEARDAAAIAAILSEFVDEADWLPRVHGHDEGTGFGALLIARCEVWVAEARGGVAGFLARRGHRIEALYVAKRARGRGVGRALMARAMAGADRLALWCFEANRAGRSFYARLGFREVRWTDGAGNDERLPDVQMVWLRVPEDG